MDIQRLAVYRETSLSVERDLRAEVCRYTGAVHTSSDKISDITSADNLLRGIADAI